MIQKLSKLLLPIWVAAAYLFLYVPLFVLVIFSFNKTAFPYRWAGFSWCWYQDLFASSALWDAVYNSFIVGLSAVALSLIIGLFFVMWIVQRKTDYFLTLFYPNLIVPEIVLAVGLLSFFIFFHIPLGLNTLVVAHTLLGLGYTIPILHASFVAFDPRLIEASLDLGATPTQTFFKIVLPVITPALLSAGLLVFILSLDDFLIAFFCAGSDAQTLSLYIFSMIRSGVSPEVNALATLMIIVSSVLVMAYSSLQVRDRIW